MKTKFTATDIPSYDGRIDLSDGIYAEIERPHDEDHEAPWEHCDGHGPVSDWESRDKRPGERILSTDRSKKRFYDYAEAIRIAKRDRWDAPPYKTGTKGEQAARAVDADFEFLRSWCADEWQYIGVCVKLFHGDGAEISRDSVWGIESRGECHREVGAEILTQLVTAYSERMEHAEILAD